MSRQVNLFNPVFLAQKKHFSAFTMAQALAIILLGCFILAAYSGYEARALVAEADAAAAQVATVRAQLEQVKTAFGLPDKSEKLVQDTLKAETELKQLQRIVQVLKDGKFGNADGYAEYMRAFARQIGPGIWLTGFSINGSGSEIVVQGRTVKPELVPAYIGRLKREPALQGKAFAVLEMRLPERENDSGSEKAGENKERAVKPQYLEFILKSSAASEAPLTDSLGTKTK